MAGRRDKKSYDNFKGNGYAQVAISTTVRLDRQSSMLVALGYTAGNAYFEAFKRHCQHGIHAGLLLLEGGQGVPCILLPRTVWVWTVKHGVCGPSPADRSACERVPRAQDVYKTAEAIRAAGGAVTKEPGPLPGLVRLCLRLACMVLFLIALLMHSFLRV